MAVHLGAQCDVRAAVAADAGYNAALRQVVVRYLDGTELLVLADTVTMGGLVVPIEPAP